MKKIGVYILFSWAPLFLQAQAVAIAEVVGKDTMPSFTLKEVEVVTKKHFNSQEEWVAFEKLKRNTVKVYPYVKIAVAIYNDMKQELEDIDRRRKQKKYISQKEKQLRERFEEDIRHFSRAQGEILIKLINRETGNSCFEIIREMKGPFNAMIWNISGKMYKLNLKEEYRPEENPDLELIVRMIERKELPVKTIQ
ncbi:MAG: hypothetical protein KatS3mg031_0424 [Chitinophagales bacterium]|nr:MAG: hypothetical protein KatS3mg031_0424 [Chitinophagales bacterium]